MIEYDRLDGITRVADTSFRKSTQAAQETYDLLRRASQVLSGGSEQEADRMLEEGRKELLARFGPKTYAVQISADFIRFHSERSRLEKALPHAIEAVRILEQFPERDQIEWGAALARCAALLRRLGREEEARAVDARTSEAWLDADVEALERKMERLEREVPRAWMHVFGKCIPLILIVALILWTLVTFVSK